MTLAQRRNNSPRQAPVACDLRCGDENAATDREEGAGHEKVVSKRGAVGGFE